MQVAGFPRFSFSLVLFLYRLRLLIFFFQLSVVRHKRRCVVHMTETEYHYCEMNIVTIRFTGSRFDTYYFKYSNIFWPNVISESVFIKCAQGLSLISKHLSQTSSCPSPVPVCSLEKFTLVTEIMCRYSSSHLRVRILASYMLPTLYNKWFPEKKKRRGIHLFNPPRQNFKFKTMTTGSHRPIFINKSWRFT